MVISYVRDSKFYLLLPEKRTLKLPKLIIIIIIVCGMSSFVLVNLKTCCTEMFVLYSSHYCLKAQCSPFHVVTMESN